MNKPSTKGQGLVRTLRALALVETYRNIFVETLATLFVWLLVVPAILAAVAGSGASYASRPELYVLALLLFLAAYLALSVFKVRRRVDLMRREFSAGVRQLEATVGLVQTLEQPVPLPTMRGSVLSPDAACLLARQLVQHKPSVVVEFGSGVSTTVVAQTLSRLGTGGHLISIDHEAKYLSITEQLLETCALRDAVTTIYAPIKPITISGESYDWYGLDLERLPNGIGFLIVDGPPSVFEPLARYPAFPALRSKLSDGAIIFVDDYSRRGETGMVRKWITECPSLELVEFDTEKGTALLTFHRQP